MNLKKGLVSIILIIILSLTFYLSKTYTLKDSYLNFINILTFKFQQEDKELFKIDFLNIYIKSLKNHNHFLIK